MQPAAFLALVERFGAGYLYTLCGQSLVAMNPYDNVAELYTEEVRALYRGLPNWQTHQMDPHLYSVGQHAFSELLSSEGEPQTIIFSGRVGSGKTESSKLMLQFLLDQEWSPALQASAVSPLFEHCFVLLEAFGNAVTRDN